MLGSAVTDALTQACSRDAWGKWCYMQTVSSTTFGRLLRQHRRGAGWTQEQLAERTGISVRSLSDMERGVSRWPHRDTVQLLADALQLATAERTVFINAARRPYAQVASGQSAVRYRSDLPSAPTPLIGREHEEAALAHLLRRDDVRLITLIGPPGVGKTRLAVQVAAAVSEGFADDVAFVELAAVRDSSLVLTTIAQSVGVGETGSRPAAEILMTALHNRRILLLLDNFEQVLEAAPVLADLLAACPQVKLLITSRAALRVRAEQEFAVPPLALPDATQPLRPPDDLSQYAAVALFVQRARAVKPAFELTSVQAPAVVEICTKLDGLPLAIELAAARIKLFPPQALLARLDHRLRLLTQGARDLPKRQRSLQQAIDWSYDLLEEDEQQLFRRLAVFLGGWTLEASESVCNTSDDLEQSNTVLARLTSLIDQSLVVAEVTTRDEPRFTLLETIREYGLVRLAASGEEETLRRQHMNYYVRLAEAAEPQLKGLEQAAWLERLERELGNLRMALDWALENRAVDSGLRLAGALHHFWRRHGRLSEGRRYLERLLALATVVDQDGGASQLEWEPVPTVVRAKALFAIAALMLWQSDASGLAPLEQSLTLFRELGDSVGVADTLHALGMSAYELGDERRGMALLEESLAESRNVGERWSTAQTLWTLGEIAYAHGDFMRAATLNEEGLALFQQVGDISYIALLTLRQGYIIWRQGDIVRATALCREALTLAHRLGDTRAMAEGIEALAMMVHSQRQVERAARLLGAAARLRQVIGEPVRPSLQPDMDRTLAALRATLGEGAFASAWEEGQTLPLEQIFT
jgi:predicted ATPase/DNA-binding XRE family transcriptional regulator